MLQKVLGTSTVRKRQKKETEREVGGRGLPLAHRSISGIVQIVDGK